MADAGTVHGGGSLIVGPPPPQHRRPAVAPPRDWGERAALWIGLVVAVVTPAVAALDVEFPGRPLLALAFVVMVPGVPVAALLRVPHRLLAVSLAGGIGIAVALLTSTIAVQTGWWNPTAYAAGIAAVGVAATGRALPRLHAPRQEESPGPTSFAGSRLSARRPARDRVASLLLLAAAVGLWWLATRWTDLDRAGPLGVIGVVGWAYVAAVVLVAVVAAYQLLRPRLDGPVLAATAGVLVVVVFGLTNVSDGTAGVPVGWLHVGFIRFISEHQASFTGLDARAYWPGFFAAGAYLVQLAGLPDAGAFLLLAPVVYNIAAIPPLLVVARCVTRSRRLAWLAVFVYLSFNWVQQDYFSPQATAFLLYLVTLALLVWMATGRMRRLAGPWPARILGALRRRPDLPRGVPPARALAWEAVLVLLAAAVVVSHQLTPAVLVLALLVFTVTGATRFRRLWLITALLFLGWFSYAASGFWIGHLSTVVGDLGRPGHNLDSAVAARVSVNGTYELMQQARLGWSLLYGLLAVLGWWLTRHRREAVLFAGLTGCAGGLFFFGSYGGEVVLRSFVFAAPLLAPLTALALRAIVRLRGRVALAAAAVLLTAAGLMITATRGVNISFERVSPDHVAAARAINDRAHPGDRVGTLELSGVLGVDRVGQIVPFNLSEEVCHAEPIPCALADRPEFILLTRSQYAARQLRDPSQPGWSTALADALVQSGVYERIYQGDDAVALRLVGQGG